MEFVVASDDEKRGVKSFFLQNVKESQSLMGLGENYFDGPPDSPVTYLIDSKQKKNMPGGTGQTFDWKIIRNFNPNKSFFLSGGLNTNNISEALNLKKTEYFDVSSGVENSEGIKDEKLISEFISKANKAVK